MTLKQELATLQSAGVDISCRCPKPCMPHSNHYRAERLRTLQAPKVVYLLDRLRQKVKAYNAATDKFLQKVESGRARSKETYADLKAARKLPE